MTSYRLGILAVCLGYILFQAIYIPYGVLARDELWFAHHIYQYTEHLPYRDFAPYKTVLGYYLLSIPMHFSHGILAPLYYIKDEIALLNALFLGFIALWARQWFEPRAIFYVLMTILSSQLFLIYSADLRVDMLASWLCLIAVLLLLNNRGIVAGVVLAFGFLFSQKAFWYIVASDGAFIVYAFFVQEPRKAWRAFFSFNLAMLITLAVYVGVWSCFASLDRVLHSVFYEAYTQSELHFYAAAYFVYWQAILQNGPLLILLLPLPLLSLFDVSIRQHPKRIFIVVYALFAMLIMAMYQQFFPYNIVFFVPALFVLYADFFSWVFNLFHMPASARVLTLNSRRLFWFLSLYMLALIEVVICFNLSLLYVGIILIPLTLWVLLEKRAILRFQRLRVVLQCVILVAVLCMGILIPLIRTGIFAYALNGQYQKDMILLTHELLQDDDEYVAGVPLLYNKDQTVAGLKNLVAPALQYLYMPEPALLPVLLPALDMEPRSVEQVLQDLQQKPIKLLVNNDRIAGLPPRILDYLRAEFEHYWGGIYIYAPTIPPNRRVFTVKFTGRYKVEATIVKPVIIDGKRLQPQMIVTLTRGEHQSRSDLPYRLRLMPVSLDINPDPTTYHDCESCFAKPIVL